jgi:hypothetical protein
MAVITRSSLAWRRILVLILFQVIEGQAIKEAVMRETGDGVSD